MNPIPKTNTRKRTTHLQFGFQKTAKGKFPHAGEQQVIQMAIALREKPMLAKFLIYIMLLSLNVLAADPDSYVEASMKKKFLKLPDGREILISYFHKINTQLFCFKLQ